MQGRLPVHIQLPGARLGYERLGYEIIADIPDYPVGHIYHVLKKTLT